jgi:four helix bundle protein
MSDAPPARATRAPAAIDAPCLDAERLDVYAVALEFQELAAAFGKSCDAVLRDQLKRASVSCVLNIAEGAGQNSRPQKRQFYGIARGSAMECAAIVDVLRVQGALDAVRCRHARGLLIRIVQMLTKLDQSLA